LEIREQRQRAEGGDRGGRGSRQGRTPLVVHIINADKRTLPSDRPLRGWRLVLAWLAIFSVCWAVFSALAWLAFEALT
jgi:hypothetical protein